MYAAKKHTMESQRTSEHRKVTSTAYYRRRVGAYKKHLLRHPNDVTFRRLHIPDEWRQYQQNGRESGVAPGENDENVMEIEDNRESDELNAEVFEMDHNINRSDQLKNKSISSNELQQMKNYCQEDSVNADENCGNIEEMQHIYQTDKMSIEEFGSDDTINDQQYSATVDEETSGPLHKDNSDTSDDSRDDDDDEEDNEDSEDEEVDSDENSESDSTWYPEVQRILDESNDKEKGFFTIEKERDWSRRMEMRNDVTKLDVVATVIATSLRGKHTYESTIMMLKNLDSMFWDSNLPRTKKSLWSSLGRNDEVATIRHMYCRICNSCIGQGKKPIKDCECNVCGPNRNNKPLSYFIEIKIDVQLRQILSDSRNVDSLRYRFTRKKKDVDAIEDIYDSKEYKKKCEPGAFLSNEYNYSFTLNTDGCKVANSANTSAWPIMLHINEFPPHARKRHTILAGIWVDDYHPNLNAVLLPTVKELNHLYREGITWTNPVDNTTITSKFTTLVCTVDSKARPEVLNMTHMNGKYGCTFCYAKGEYIRGTGVKRSYPVENSINRRTHVEIQRNMREAHQTGEKVSGIKGMSVLAIVLGFDFRILPVWL